MRGRAFAWVALAYAVAGAVGVGAGRLAPPDSPLLIAAVATFAATLAIFAFSLSFNNSSFYDAYWSVAPIPIVFYWAENPPGDDVNSVRMALVLTAVTVWGVRLTYNWARQWQGLHHEDWRYVDKRREFPRAYWVVSLTGLHVMPTILVFIGLLPCWVALGAPAHPIGPIDGLALLAVCTAIYFETVADKQLRDFMDRPRAPGESLTSGLWGLCRHPNYFGEVLFWWGLFLFGLAANPTAWWCGAGALAMSVLFRVVSLPLMERRAAERRKDWDRISREIPLILPWPRL
jgi:steroid 5-alpha reductase family enzyme